MTRRQWIVKAVPALLITASLVVTGGCGLFSKQATSEIDPPPADWQEKYGDAEQTMAMAEGEGSQLTVYLKDRNGYIAPVTLAVPLADNQLPEQAALEVMVDGGPYASLLPDGFEPVLSKGTQILKLDLVKDQELAIVDVNDYFTGYNAQDERKIVEAVTWTLTGFPEVKQVQLRQNGEKLAEMPVDGFPLAGTLTRHIGINLERADGVDYARSTPVTLYFSALTPDDTHYYVPVTRLIDRSEDVAAAAMHQLIAGPMSSSHLTRVMTDDLQVGSIKVEQGVVTVDLLDETYKEGQLTPSEMIQSVILSLTENTGASKVRIHLNGSANVTGTDNRSYSEPVDRPSYLNAIKS
ncbi:GerMN domain-containing protein [Paenibacillus sp. SYP-B4298]|uniref:GerMN domain-containing protein n=1 Tax=Paenibacillus sp. SYP-B4298 TaxID=2996034 RepID=UPI0022DD08E3|nr:GerMN domain-containing protein [Paenibacillus sp. SYP-B4298]